MSVDSPRLLHRRLELAYTETIILAAAGEPEAVGADVQQQLTRRATRTAFERRRHAYRERRLMIEVELDALITAGIVGPQDLRLVRRELDRLERRILPE